MGALILVAELFNTSIEAVVDMVTQEYHPLAKVAKDTASAACFVADMVAAGILDPAKVTRSALQNATSVASTLLTTESVVADIKEPEAPAAPAGGMGGGMGGMY